MIFLKLEISSVQLNLIAYVIIKFELIILICEFDLNDSSENHLIIINFIDFEHFNNKNVNNNSI